MPTGHIYLQPRAPPSSQLLGNFTSSSNTSGISDQIFFRPFGYAFNMEQTSCSLLSLSTELILQIVGYNAPPDILALSLTCSDLHHRCQSLLEQHQDAYKTYRITSDLSPETVVDLLKDNPAAEINRYHVRELEFWGSRLGWQDWRPWNPARSGNYQLAKEEPSRSAWDTGEVQRYIEMSLGLWGVEGKINKVQMSLEQGSEAWLKLFLICLCPRLHSIRIVKRRGDPYSILKCMADVIGWTVCVGWLWPPGFESLRSIAVGISMLSHVSHEEPEEYYDGFEEFTMLFHIPNLKSIYFSGLSCEEYMWEQHIWDEELLPDGTSNVENLFLDGVEGGWDEFYDWLSRASTKLDTVVLRAIDSRRGGLHDVCSFVDSLANTNEVLNRLVLYHPEAIYDQPCRQTEICNHESVKLITIAAHDLDFRFEYTLDGRAFRKADITRAFPPNIEAVYIWGEWKGFGSRDRRGLGELDLFLAELIESGVYKNLKIVYVEHPYKYLLESIRCDFGLEIARLRDHAFERAIAAGYKAGVNVCTHMNWDVGGYWKTFPARPDLFDIKTGPYAAERPADWKINLETGEWEPDWMWRL